MYGIDNYFGFLLAGIILNVTPGADTFYILTRSVAQGRRAGVYSVLGILSGCLVHTTLAALGLSIILARSVLAFTVIKYLGVGYLLFLGIRMIREKDNLFDNAGRQMAKADLFRIYRDGFFTDFLNPKVILFFLSFLPQFIDPHKASGPLPFMILGLTFMTTGGLWCLMLAYGSSWITGALRNNDRIGKFMQKISGVIFIGLGVRILTDK